MLVALALSCLGLLASDDRPSPSPSSLPSALPALDERLLDLSSPPVAAFADARLRGIVEQRADGDGDAGGGWTGRVGVASDVGVLHGAVVIGDQGWWLGANGPAQPGPALSTPPPAPALLHATLSVPLPVVGLPARLAAGRMTPVVADGRWWGPEPFDARGRTSDGVLVDVDVADDAGAWSLSSGLFARTDADGAPAGFAALSRRHAHGDVDVYAMGDRTDAAAAADADAANATRGLLGARARLETGPLQLRAGADALAVVDDASSTTRPAWHGELAFATRLPWTKTSPQPFVDVGIEATGGPARWGTPAPTVHGTMGALDLVDVDNTVQLRAAAGVVGTGDEDGFDVVIGWRHVGRLTERRPLSRPGGGAVSFDRVDEVDVDVVVPVDDGAALQFAWSGAPQSAGLVQRLLVSLTFALNDDGDRRVALRHGPSALGPVVVPGERAGR